MYEVLYIFQQPLDSVVAHWLEVAIPEAESVKDLWNHDADDGVSLEIP
jgi:hypothetical protein